MVKKMVKYSKFILCIALIFSLVAPSYAALSASDGSAFVTKAEFDSALADFNARLTTFEAGINSKIDSQVTSYLDRNGIWNGKKQISNLDDAKFFNFSGFGLETNSDNLVFKTGPNTNSSYVSWPIGFANVTCGGSTAKRLYATTSKKSQTLLFIANVSKSGLLCFDLIERLDACWQGVGDGFVRCCVEDEDNNFWSDRFFHGSDHSATALLNEQLGTSGAVGLNSYGLKICSQNVRGINGYYGNYAYLTCTVYDQYDNAKWSSASYKFSGNDCAWDRYYSSMTDTAPHLYLVQMFVSQGDVLRLDLSLQAFGRRQNEKEYQLQFICSNDGGTSLPSSNKWPSLPYEIGVVYYATRNVQVY